MTDRNMEIFLNLVPLAGWRNVPVVWNDQLREALSGGLVTVGWGGVIELTDVGRKRGYEQNAGGGTDG